METPICSYYSTINMWLISFKNDLRLVLAPAFLKDSTLTAKQITLDGKLLNFQGL